MVDSSDGWFCAGIFLKDDSLDATMNLPSNFKLRKKKKKNVVKCFRLFVRIDFSIAAKRIAAYLAARNNTR